MATQLTLDQVVASNVKRRGLQWCTPFLYWLEQRPQEAGRGVIVQYDPVAQLAQDMTPPSWSVRSKVHEYGGGDFLATEQGLFFVNASDQQIYCQRGTSCKQVTAGTAIDTRYADFTYDDHRQKLYAVRERHSDDVINDVVCIDLNGCVEVVASGADFYAAPRLSPNGLKLCWLQWSLPSMPWDYCELIELDLHHRSQKKMVSHKQISVLAPYYDVDNELWFVDDRDGFWRVRKFATNSSALSPANADCGIAAWSLGQQPFCPITQQDVLSVVFVDGKQRLARNSFVTEFEFEECGSQLINVNGDVYFFASTATQTESLYCLSTKNELRQLAVVNAQTIAQVITAKTIWVDGVHAYFYRPPADKPVPLVVFCHSGPTGLASSALNLVYQYYLQCGFAILDINYRGSYGFGRAYRQALLGHWGQYDVQDCAAVIQHIVATYPIDSRRIYLRGNSAGGLTALTLLVRSPGYFRAAALRYPVVDLLQLQSISHKFELGYLAELIGAKSETDEAWRIRSPISNRADLKTPVLIMHGQQDPVVPIEQAEVLIATLQKGGIACELLSFLVEGHGFRRSDSLRACLKAEIDWFNRHG